MSYTVKDGFDRADTGAGGVGGGWIDASAAWKISGGKATPVDASVSSLADHFLLRPVGEAFAHGRKRVFVPDSTSAAIVVMRVNGTKNVGAYCFPGSASRAAGGGLVEGQAEVSFLVNGTGGIRSSETEKLGVTGPNQESYDMVGFTAPYYLDVEAAGHLVVARVYATDGTTLLCERVLDLANNATVNYTNAVTATGAAPLTPGQWGLGDFGGQSFDAVYDYAGEPYTFVDSFTRSDSTAIGNNWAELGTTDFSLASNHLVNPADGVSFAVHRLLRPIDESFTDGKIRVRFDAADNAATILCARVQGAKTGKEAGVGAYIWPQNNVEGSGGFNFFRLVNGSDSIAPIAGTGAAGYGTSASGYFELDLSGSTMTATLTDLNGNVLHTQTYSGLTGDDLMPGTHGMLGFSSQQYTEYAATNQSTFALPPATALAVSSPTGYPNHPITVAVAVNGSLSTDVLVTVQFTGVEGTASASTVTLTAAQPTGTLTFTPHALGSLTIDASAAGLTTGAATVSIVTEPVVLGFIGDSITDPTGANTYVPVVAGMVESAGGGARSVTVVNKGASGRTTRDWLPASGLALLTGAVTAFNGAGVRVVSIMLGTNDCKISEDISKAAYKANLQAIVAYLFANVPTLAGVVLQYAPDPVSTYAYPGNSDWSPTDGVHGYHRVLEYHDACDELVAADVDGKLFAGSKGAYLRFEQAPSLLPDGIHPAANSEAGYVLAGANFQGIARALGVAPELGNAQLPDPEDVRAGVDRGDGTPGTLDLPMASDVRSGTEYDGGAKTGTFAPSARPEPVAVGF